MSSKKMICWVGAVLLLVLFLIVIIVRLDRADNYISRAMASKAMALALTDKESCVASQRENGTHFSAQEREEWFAKYIDYLMERELFENNSEADKDFAASPLTYGEAAYAAEKLSPGLSQALNISKKKYGKPMPKEAWWLFYETFLKTVDTEQAVERQKLLLYGTPANVKEAAPWTAYTDQGILGFEGVTLDSHIDHEIEVILRGGEIIRMPQDVTDEVTYKNVWLTEGDEKHMYLYVGTIAREFPSEKEIEEQTGGALADVTLKKGKITKMVLKTDTIEGKVLAVREDSIEVEGYGTLRLDDNFKVYKTYGVVKEQRKKDILVGYDLQQFVVADKKICAALLVKSFSAKNIRVLIMDTGFNKIYHDEIRLKSDTPLQLSYKDSVETLAAGQELVLKKDDERLKSGRLTVEPEDKRKGIQVLSVERSQGNPSYYGCFEISREEKGLLLLNELDMEDYLTKVVPSEMPPSYELEALKAQAVCARTYAYRQIRANAYSQFGAHVDDSTNYQVYNNLGASDRTDMAIKETYGEMVFYKDSPAETYYFSTSCGHTADGTIWGASLEDFPYLKGVLLVDGKKAMDLTVDKTFEEFIRGDDTKTYDSAFPMYRWKTDLTNKELENRTDSSGKRIGDMVGTVQAVLVTERGTGGSAKTVKIVGSKGEKTLKGQSQIRKVLGSNETEYKKNDGKILTGTPILPSAFIFIDETARDDEKGIRTFTIWGGGNGHGVGMSQNGAHEMAKQGKSYKEILQFFYDDVEVKECEIEGSS